MNHHGKGMAIIQWSGEILDHISTPVAYMDYDLRVIRVNQAFADFHHKPIRFFTDRPLFAVDPNHHREEVYRAAIAEWKTSDFPAGATVQCGYWRLSCLRNHQGQKSGLLMTMEPSLPRQEVGIPEMMAPLDHRDIRRFARFSLRQQGVIFKANVSGRIEVSEGDCFALPEFSHGLAVGRNIFELFQSCPEFSHALYRASEGSVVREPLRIRDYELDVFISPWYDDGGAIGGVIGVAIDNEERRQYEQRLVHAKDFLSRLLDAMPDLIWYKDEKGYYLGCNRAFAAFVGLPKKAILGKRDNALFEEERVLRLRHMHERVVETGKPHHLTDTARDHAGKVCELETTEAPVFRHHELMATAGISRKLKYRKRKS